MTRSKSWGFPRWGGYGSDQEAVTVRMCDWQGCGVHGDHPAPKFRDSDERFWFCKEHAAAYNRNWDYFKGMSPEEAERHVNKEEAKARGYRDSGTWQWVNAGLTKEERERIVALEVLELDEMVTQDEIKASFRRLAKIYHPDANQGNEDAAENFKSVCAAYEILKE